jgi:hypothetical protein
VIGLLTLFTIISVLLIPGKDFYSFLIIAWIGFIGSQLLAITFFRYRLKVYLKSILEDIGIDNTLKKIAK